MAFSSYCCKQYDYFEPVVFIMAVVLVYMESRYNFNILPHLVLVLAWVNFNVLIVYIHVPIV